MKIYRIEGIAVPPKAARLIQRLSEAAQTEAFTEAFSGSAHPDDRHATEQEHRDARRKLAQYISDLSHTIGHLTNEAHGG